MFLIVSNFEIVLRIEHTYQGMIVEWLMLFPMKMSSTVLSLDHFYFFFQPLILSSHGLNLILTQAVCGFFPASSHLPVHIMALPGALSVKWHAEAAFHGSFITKIIFPCFSYCQMYMKMENGKKPDFSSGFLFKSISFKTNANWIWCSFS